MKGYMESKGMDPIHGITLQNSSFPGSDNANADADDESIVLVLVVGIDLAVLESAPSVSDDFVALLLLIF